MTNAVTLADKVRGLIEEAADFEQTADEARAELVADGVDVAAFVARVRDAVDEERLRFGNSDIVRLCKRVEGRSLDASDARMVEALIMFWARTKGDERRARESIAAEADRMGAGAGEVRGMALTAEERRVVELLRGRIAFLFGAPDERRRDADAAPVDNLAHAPGRLLDIIDRITALLALPDAPTATEADARPMLTEWARVPLSATMHARCENVLGGMMVGASAHADGEWRVNAPGEVPARQVARGRAPDLATAKRDADLAALQWYQLPASRAGGGQ
jgi:hypothetical protein